MSMKLFSEMNKCMPVHSVLCSKSSLLAMKEYMSNDLDLCDLLINQVVFKGFQL